MSQPQPPGQQPYQPQQYPPPPQQPYQQQAYGPPPGYELKRKKPFYKRVWFWLLIIVVLVVILIVSAVSKVANDATSKPHAVVYSVTGSEKADITYASMDGSGRSQSHQLSGVKIPWSKKVTIKGDFSGFDVSATPSSLMGKHGKLSCKITVDGKTVSTDSSQHGGFVGCSGDGYSGQ